MSGLRDARLHKALESAPDEGERPREDTRAAIRAHAHSAVRPARTPWWKKVYEGAGASRHLPWNAAFATVAVATLVTLLWHDREVPDARTALPESSSTAAAPAPSTPVQPVSPPAEPAAELKAAAPQPPRAKGVDSAAAEKRAEVRSSEQQRKQAAPAVPSESARERASAHAAADQAGRESVGGLAKETPAADGVPMLAPMAPTARSAPAPAAAAPPARLQNQSQLSEASTILRVVLQGRTVQAPLVRPSVLSDLMDRASREATGTQPLQAPVELRVELAREQLTLGVLEIAGTQLRWTPMNGPARTATPDPALLQALREEIGRLGQR